MEINTAEIIEEYQEEPYEEPLAIELYNNALALQVVDNVSCETAGNMLLSLKEAKRVISDNLAAPKKAAYDRWKRICSIETDRLQPFDNAEKHLRNEVSQYQTKLMLERQEQERKARIAAAEAARKEQERILAQAEKAEQKGKAAKAEELLEKAESVYAEPVAIPAPKKTVDLANGSMAAKKDLEIVLPTDANDIKLLCAAIVAGKIPVGVVEFKKTALKQWAKMNAVTGKYHGVVFREIVSTSVRR